MLTALGLADGHYLSVEEVDPRKPGPHDIVVRVGASGVCHTDVAVPATCRCHCPSSSATRAPETGSEVTSVAVGDRVIGTVGAVCGTCWYCVRDMTHLCDNSMAMTSAPRVKRTDGTEVPAFVGLGTFAEAMTVHDASVVPVTTDLPDEQLALIGCAITTGLGAVFNTAQVKPASSIVVIGSGGVGQAVIQGARIAGAARIIAVDPLENKRSAALGSGATDTIDPTSADLVDEVRRLTGGRGAHHTFEVVRNPTTITQAWDAARRGGTVALVGMPAADAMITMPALSLASDDKPLCGSLYGGTQARRDIPLIVELAETGRLDLASMVTRRVPLHEVNDAIRALEAG
jgi:S-(hydroxymethyl)glutathione dehydrogenase/alcohol dehydrogenase